MKNLQSLLNDLISIPSVTNDLDNCTNALVLIKSSMGDQYSCEEFESKKVNSLFFFSKKYSAKTQFKIILNAHIDVVPAQPEQFKPMTKEGKIFGRGAQDMKSGAAVMIEVFKELADQVSYPLGLQIVTDEETGGNNGVEHQLGKGIRADFAISGESTNLDVVHKAKGIMRVKVTTKGKSAHSAYPWNGVNAIEGMTSAIQDLKSIFKPVKENMWDSTINVAKINTDNEAFNMIPASCTAYLDIRYVKEDKDRILEELKKRNSDHCEVNVEFTESAHDSNPDSSFIQKLSESIEKVTASKPVLRGAHGASDIRHFDENGMTGVEFGPSGGGLHTEEEWVSIKSIDEYFSILKDFLLRIDIK